MATQGTLHEPRHGVGPATYPRAAGLARRLGVGSAGALVAANMIGAGVFTTSGFALAGLGRRDWVMWAWLIGGLLAMCGALSYGALARRFPESGGEYLFLSRALHPLAGFLAGWVSLLAGFTAPIAAAALGLQAYLLPEGAAGLRPEWLGTAVILSAVLMHGVRLKHGVVLQNFTVGLMMLLIAGLSVYGAFAIGARGIEPAPASVRFDLGEFCVTLVWISFAYSGWNAAVYVAGEVADPQRTLARALWLATGAVTLIYLAVNTVFLYSAPVAELAGKAEVGAVAAEALGGPGMRTATSFLVALALFTSISSMVMAGPRVYARMADDGVFPRAFSPRGEVPRAAVVLQGTLAVLVVWNSGLAELLGYIGFTLSLSSATAVGALIVLRLREGRAAVPVPGFPWIPLVFVLATLGACTFMILRRPQEALMGVATVVAGIPLYWLLRRRASPV